jgi:hypothetical protein
MKRIPFLLITLCLVASSCRFFGIERKNTPEYVTKQFLTHFQKLEFDEASQYGTENTKMMLRLFKSLSNMVPDSTKSQNNFSNAEIKKCTIEGNTAICSYTANGKEETIDLIKEDGKWLINLKKEQKNPLSPGK